MKNTKKLAIILMAVVMVLTVVLAACDVTKHDYTVKVVGTDGKPYTTALVQPCLVEDGALTMCYQGVATDAKGVAHLDIGKEIPNDGDATIDEIEVHLLNLPATLTYTAPRMHKGDTVTITLVNNIKTPTSGAGTGSYLMDVLTDEPTNLIDGENFDPYVVEEGSYTFSFTTAEQKIYFAFKANQEANYSVSASGDVDATVTQLLGTALTGIRNPNEASYTSSGSDFYYEFEVEPATIENHDGLSYFELSLNNAGDVNKEAVITFEYVSEYQQVTPPEVVDVEPANTLTPYGDQDAFYIDADFDGSFVYVKGSDGYYHVGDEDGAIVVATLGKNDTLPNCLELTFTAIYEQGQTFTWGDGVTYANNYYPLVAAYTEASNSEGRYPLTDELIDFFNQYIACVCSVSWLESQLNMTLPVGEEWLVWCGYYYVVPEAAGTEDDPKTFETGMLDIDVAAGESIYYSARSFSDIKYIIMADSTNVKVTVYSAFDPDNAEIYTSEDYGFYCEVEVSAWNMFYFVFSTIDGAADSYSVRVTEEATEAEEGTEDNPFEITYLGDYYNYVEDAFAGLYYKYTAMSDITLYFDWEENNTYILVIYGYSYITIDDEDGIATLTGGLQVSEGDEIIIMVSTLDWEPGEIMFTISDTPIAD